VPGKVEVNVVNGRRNEETDAKMVGDERLELPTSSV
jgi:hypothetical protein